MDAFDVVISQYSAGPSVDLALLLERELGLSAEEAYHKAQALPQAVLTRVSRNVADQTALRLLGAGAHVAVRPSQPPPAFATTEVSVSSSSVASRYELGDLSPSVSTRSPESPRSASLPPRAEPIAHAHGDETIPAGTTPDFAIAHDQRAMGDATLPVDEYLPGRVFHTELDPVHQPPLELDEQAVRERNVRVRSTPPVAHRYVSLPPAKARSALSRVFTRTFVLALVTTIAWALWPLVFAPSRKGDEPSSAPSIARGVQRFFAPIRELTVHGMHVVSVTWPVREDALNVRCVLLEEPADEKIAVLGNGRTVVDIPKSVASELNDHVSVLREARADPKLVLTPLCFRLD